MLVSHPRDYLNRAVGTQSYDAQVAPPSSLHAFDNSQWAADTLALENCMRVPVYLSDLESQSGFKRIAKVLSRDWPGTSPLSLSQAREILSHAFGYTDYHDVTICAKDCRPDAVIPSEAQVQIAIEQAVLEVGQGSTSLFVTPADLSQLVKSLPLHALSALKPPPTANPRSPSAPTASLGQSSSPDASANDGSPANRATRPLPLPASHIESITRVVEKSGNLRDLTLLSFMLCGLRGHEFLGVKAGQVQLSHCESEQPSRIPVLVKVYKSSGKDYQDRMASPVSLSSRSSEILRKYMDSLRLDADDFLFPSATDPKRPMSHNEFSAIYKEWSTLAKANPKSVSAANIRRSILTSIATGIYPTEISLLSLTEN